MVTFSLWAQWSFLCASGSLVFLYMFRFLLKKTQEKAMATHSSTLAWQISWKEEPGRLQSMGSLGIGHNWATSLSLSCIGEGNGNPFQCSCLENPRDGGAWWAAVYEVTQSWTRLKRVSSKAVLQVNMKKIKVRTIKALRNNPQILQGKYIIGKIWLVKHT